MKFLITGANGYIGRHVVKHVLDLGHEVIASDFRFDNIDKRASTISTPIFSGDADVFEQLGRPDGLIHLAWRDGFVHNSAAHMSDLSKHIIFLNNMMKGGLKNLSIMGTMHEIGYWEGPVDEFTPCNPQSQYGIAKNALRQSVLLSASENNCNLKWLRAYYITGDDEKSNSIFAKILKSSAEGAKEFPFTSGKNKYDFIDVDKLAELIAVSSIQTQFAGIINVCTGKPMSLAEKVEAFISEHNLDIKLIYGAYPDRKYDSPGIWGDSTKINKIIKETNI